MANTIRNADLNSAISVASYVIYIATDTETGYTVKDWLQYEDVFEMALEKWSRPHQRTLVHDYIEFVYIMDQDYLLRKHFPVPVIKELQGLLENYNIDYSSVEHEGALDFDDRDWDDEYEKYADRLQKFFIEHLLDIVVDDVFTVLYADKNFLHEFNRQCAEVIKTLKIKDFPKYLQADGVFKRVNYYPEWMKRGIEHRDKSRCSLCGCDLSVAHTTITNKNFDHIIPLKEGGNNDPSNWQLTCEHCNKSKGARNTGFKNIVFPFWEVPSGEKNS